jgi:hypothetical protein
VLSIDSNPNKKGTNVVPFLFDRILVIRYGKDSSAMKTGAGIKDNPMIIN